ncbi:MAG: sigma-70 family RNA polymerase sigma factor [Candidatus Latescibacteria bacterium]|nr:sigma-70 family RNA polymerase sigma factor [Candidatus Latescibacterota bacterium]
MELRELVLLAQRGDLPAYNRLVKRFQHVATGYAYSILGDFHLAQDAAQEAFIRVYLDITSLKKPEAFSSWLRTIVHGRCTRITRLKRFPTLELEDAGQIPSREVSPDREVEEKNRKGRLLEAIRSLPQEQRTVISLFYMEAYSQKKLADFLNVPLSTVNYRLHAARNTLREELLGMTRNPFDPQRSADGEQFAEAA